MSNEIYLDHAATTVLDAEVVRVVKQYLDKPINANPSSRHKYGLDMQSIIRSSKHQIATLLGISSFKESNIVFTSGATEANNLVIMGHCLKNQKLGNHIILSPSEHDCVREAVFALCEKHGFTYSLSKLLSDGQIDLKDLESLIKPNTILVCQMAVSNIFGTVYDIESVAKIMKAKCPNALLHIDAVQAIGKIKFNLPMTSTYVKTTISLSGHKIHGPKGIGLVAFDHPKTDQVLEIEPIIYGGGQEHGTRPGTENLLGIVAIAKCLSRAMMELGSSQKLFHKLHTTFTEKFKKAFPTSEIAWIIPEVKTHQAIISLVTPTVPAEVVFNHLVQNKVYVSVGSACQARDKKLSPALVSRFSKDTSLARHVLRISFSRFSKITEVFSVIRILSKILPPLHESSPLRKVTAPTNLVAPPPTDPTAKTAPPNNNVEKKKKEVVSKKNKNDEMEEEGEDMPSKPLTGVKRKKPGRQKREQISDDFLNMEYTRILCRVGELALKKKNRKMFERQLQRNIRVAVRSVCACNVDLRDRRLYVSPQFPKDRKFLPRVADRLTKVFGLTSLSLCYRVKNDFDVIKEVVTNIARKKYESRGKDEVFKFRVSCKRSQKHFPMNSMEVAQQLGRAIRSIDHEVFQVDLKRPEYDIGVDIRIEGTYIFTEKIQCSGGLPVGTTGKGVTLLSGGIDSPVASYMMMKRGLTVNYVSFFSFPYTSERYVQKLKMIGQNLAMYQQPDAKMHFVPLTKIQEAVRDNCKPESYRTILYRRAMNTLALMVAKKLRASCLITGESLGQVASQTISNITTIFQPVGKHMPILRPLIGMDKGEIMEIGKKIGTIEISNMEAADTCTLFKPSSPAITSKIEVADKIEKRIENYQKLMDDAIANMVVVKLSTDMLSEDQKEFIKEKREEEEEEEEEEIRKIKPPKKKRKVESNKSDSGITKK